MTVRTAELLFAIILALCSLGLMIKSSELNIGWIDGKGPGSGAWPFWLSTGMLVCCIWTIIRWFRGTTPESRSRELYMSRSTIAVVGVSAGSLLMLLVLTQYAGIYIALVVFLFLYLRFIGGHSWALTITLSICVPVFIFSLFEWALKIPLPKAFTDPWFYPMYDLIYAQNMTDAVKAFKAPIVALPAIGVVGSLGYWVYQWITSKGRTASTATDTADA